MNENKHMFSLSLSLSLCVVCVCVCVVCVCSYLYSPCSLPSISSLSLPFFLLLWFRTQQIQCFICAQCGNPFDETGFFEKSEHSCVSFFLSFLFLIIYLLDASKRRRPGVLPARLLSALLYQVRQMQRRHHGRLCGGRRPALAR